MRSIAGLAASVMVATLIGCGSNSESSEPMSGPFVFTSEGDNETSHYPGLRTAGLDGSGERQLTPPRFTHAKRTRCRGLYEGEYDENGYTTLDPQWSPDGSRVAFSRDELCSFPVGNRYSIWTIKADGTELRRVTPSAPIVSFETLSYESPTWSPNGKQIGYVARRHAWNLAGDIYVMNADGTGRRRLTRQGDIQAPAWSPDGRRIAFERWDPPDPSESAPPSKTDIFVMDLRNGRLRRLTRSGDAGAPEWSPDGRRITYSGGGVRELEVFVMNSDGTSKRNLSRHPADDDCPVWSADGMHIAFESVRDAQSWGIYVIAADGTGQPRRVAWSDAGCLDWAAQR